MGGILTLFVIVIFLAVIVGVPWVIIHQVRKILRRQRLQEQANQAVIDNARRGGPPPSWPDSGPSR